MTKRDKITIPGMRATGRQYEEISAEPGIEVSALKAFVHRHDKPGARKCAKFGKRLSEGVRADQRFRSMQCKKTRWKKHLSLDGNFDSSLIVPKAKMLLLRRNCFSLDRFSFWRAVIPQEEHRHGARTAMTGNDRADIANANRSRQFGECLFHC